MRAVGDYVQLRLELEEESKGGIALVNAKERAEVGVVISIGANVRDENGNPITPEFKVGDRLVFNKKKGFSRAEPVVLGKEHLFVRYCDCVAMLDQNDQ